MKERRFGTWSIAARDPDTGQFGIAVASRYLAVGAWVPHIRPNVAAVCLQSWSNPALAPRIFGAIEAGLTPDEAIAEALSHDGQPGRRQIGLIDYLGRTATYTGAETQAEPGAQWWGDEVGDGFVVAGNTLTGFEVVVDTAATFSQLLSTRQPLGWRLLQALAAGEAAGGDHRGKQAAALLLGGVGPTAEERLPALDLRVDDHAEPIQELMRVYRVACPDAL